MPTSYYWTGATDGDFDTAGNWSPSGPPTTGDSVIFDGRSTRALVGEDKSAITLASIAHYASCLYAVGTSALPLKIGASAVAIGLPAGDGSTATPQQVHLDLHTVESAVSVYRTASVGTGGVEPCTIKGSHTSNTFAVSGSAAAIVGIATASPADAATFATITVDNRSARVRVGAGVTTTTATVYAGDLVLRCAASTLSGLGGTMTTEGSGAITSVSVANRAVLSSTGTITNLYAENGGTADLTSSRSARTVTNAFVSGTGRILTGLHVTHTNGVDLLRGADSSQVSFGSNVTVTPSGL